MIPLNTKKIIQRLNDENIEFIYLDTVDSTHQFLKNYTLKKRVAVCCAEMQTQGRGRLGRTWSSPQGGNLYYSIRLSIPLPCHQLMPLSLITALSVTHILKKIDNNLPIQIKWPNDLMIMGKKLAGILIEILNTHHTYTSLIIGVGINLYTHPEITQPTTSLNLHTKKIYDRSDLLAQLIQTQLQDITKFQTQGWKAFQTDFEKVDSLKGEKLTRQSITGIACGVNQQGYLLIQDAQGELHTMLTSVLLRD